VTNVNKSKAISPTQKQLRGPDRRRSLVSYLHQHLSRIMQTTKLGILGNLETCMLVACLPRLTYIIVFSIVRYFL